MTQPMLLAGSLLLMLPQLVVVLPLLLEMLLLLLMRWTVRAPAMVPWIAMPRNMGLRMAAVRAWAGRRHTCVRLHAARRETWPRS